jgi:hypothetical protein
MKEIPLTQGKVALVDDEDFERVSQHKWYAHKSRRSWYAKTAIRRGKQISMHHFLVGDAMGKEIDHKNGNGLDNQRGNLRPATDSANRQNAPKQVGRSGIPCSSPYKGVYRKSLGNRGKEWRACIRVKGRSYGLGSFTDERSAARTYDQAAMHYFGEFARTNFIQIGELR